MFTTQTNDVFQRNSGIEILDNKLEEDVLIEKYKLDECVKWIEDNNYEVTCLQFPEALLNDGTSVALYLQKKLGKTVYILADTCYGSCCVDEVGADHVKADSIIHFGHACLSLVVKLPVFYVFLKKHLNAVNLLSIFKCVINEPAVIVFYDDTYHHLYSELCDTFKDYANVYISRLNINHENLGNDKEFKVICGRIFPKLCDTNISAVYIGNQCITLENLVLSLPAFKWFQMESEDDALTECQFNRNKFLMKRTALVEKIKEASTVGILIGTLGIKNYLDAIERIRQLVKKSGKKCYKLVVGKPNIAKLANFPEIDVFVCVSCQENALLKDFKGYYKPIVSLIEIEMALGNRPYSLEYSADFRELLPGGLFYKEVNDSENFKKLSGESKELVERHEGTLIESSGANFLLNRSWQGLEQRIGETVVTKSDKGRSGIAQSYENEFTTLAEENKQ